MFSVNLNYFSISNRVHFQCFIFKSTINIMKVGTSHRRRMLSRKGQRKKGVCLSNEFYVWLSIALHNAVGW